MTTVIVTSLSSAVRYTRQMTVYWPLLLVLTWHDLVSQSWWWWWWWFDFDSHSQALLTVSLWFCPCVIVVDCLCFIICLVLLQSQFQSVVMLRFLLFLSANSSVPWASKSGWLSDWVIDWVGDFSPWASSAMEAAKETKFGAMVA